MIKEIIKTETVLGKVLHVYGTPENPLFIAREVADWIGHSNPTEMVRSLDDDEKLHSTILRTGLQQREVVMVTEFGLYEILMISRRPYAKAFKKEIKRILNELRVHGVSMTENFQEKAIADPEWMIKVLQEYSKTKKEKRILEIKNKALAETNDKQKPSYDFVRRYFESEDTLTMAQCAKILDVKHGRNTVFSILRTKGILRHNNEPYQTYVTKGFFKIRMAKRGGIYYPQTRVTPKGLGFLAKEFGVLLIEENLPKTL